MTLPPQSHLRLDLLRDPLHREPLSLARADQLSGSQGEIYPVVDGIPILLPDAKERQRIVETDWSAPTVGSSTIDFYNQTRDQDQYCRAELDASRAQIERWLSERRAEGPTLEIGSGKGALQGIGGEYVALDYSFTALRKYVSPEHLRVCGTAEALPFPDGAFSYIFTLAALEHVPRADLAFAEIDRVLKPGGVAFLSPAWHCTQYNCDGLPVRPYKDLSARQKVMKALLPAIRNPLVKAAARLPTRVARRVLWNISRRPTHLAYRQLRPDYERFWLSDSDAASSIDSHEGCLFFQSRGYEMLNPGRGAIKQLFCRHVGLVARKPA